MDLHRHTHFSSYDGFDNSYNLAAYAKELGHTALGISDHGNTNGLVQHYLGCKEVGIKPVLGVEGYFLPVYKEQHRGYHLCLFAKSAKGYHNLNVLQYEGEKQKYYNPIWTFQLLEQYHEDLICTSACVASYSSQCIKDDRVDKAEKYYRKMLDIFGNDFYIEIQPYKISEKGLQEKVNIANIKLAKKLGIKCILTSDSHRGKKEDFPTYLKMHEMAGHDLEHISDTYKERYMPSDDEMADRFIKMHGKDFKAITRLSEAMIANLKEIEDKVEEDIFKDFTEILPKLSGDSVKKLQKDIKAGLQKRNKWKPDYIARVKEEFNVIKQLGFADYFLIVADYVNWAKSNGIVVGPGRGSVCNCLAAYALGITEVDSLLFGLDFRRFLRLDKIKYPDIDTDFETGRRDEVIAYVENKYKGRTARIASYGLYKLDNLINDLAKVCTLPTDKSVDSLISSENKKEIAAIKKVCKQYIDEDGKLDNVSLLSDPEAAYYNKRYDNILTHFTKLYGKVRYIGTHAAGIAVTGGDILDYTALRIDKSGSLYANYDLNDIEHIHVIKFDMLGLNTMAEIRELREATGAVVDYDTVVEDRDVMSAFANGDTDGIFQFGTKTPAKILQKIGCDSFDDVVATNAMNRPGPLSLNMPDAYAENKHNIGSAQDTLYYPYTKESYGTIIYQEQIQQICVYLGNMSWPDADRVMKMISNGASGKDKREQTEKEMREKFLTGAKANGLSKQDAESIFNAMLVYSFNKGHACGYSLISAEEMYYKVHFPVQFWYGKIKYAPNADLFDKYCAGAVKSGCVVFLPHINYSDIKTKIRLVEGEPCLQQGLADINGIGDKAATEIWLERKQHGIFTNFDNFYDRCKSRVVNERVIKILKENGNAEFKKQVYINRVTKYNTALLQRSMA